MVQLPRPALAARSCGHLLLLSPLLLLLPSAPQPAQAAGRIAALVLGVDDMLEELADQCSEVLVAAISRSSESEIVGKEEFLARLSLPARTDVEQCLQARTCMARAVTVLDLESVILGYLGQEKQTYRLQLLRIGGDGSVKGQLKRELGAKELLSGIAPMVEDLLRVREATLRVESNPRSAQVYINDRPRGTTPLAITVPLGLHSLRVELAGCTAHRQAVELNELGLTVRVELKKSRDAPATTRSSASPAAAGKGAKILAWSLGGVSALALASGGALHVLAYRDARAYGEATKSQDLVELKERGEQRWVGALICYGSGLALAGGAAAILWFRSRQGASADPVAGSEGHGLRVGTLTVVPDRAGPLLLLGGTF